MRADGQILRGRDHELEEIVERLSRARDGIGSITLVEGAPGVGKSRLIAEAIRTAERLGMRVAGAEANRSGRELELGVLSDALVSGRDPVVPLSAAEAAQASANRRYWLVEEIQTGLERAAAVAPILVWVDDAQWADAATVSALLTLSDVLQSLPIAWIVAYRPSEPGTKLARATRDRAEGSRITLAPLTRAATAEVTRDLLHDTPSAELLGAIDAANGNPFALIELLKGLAEENLIVRDRSSVGLAGPAVPARVRDATRRRLARLTPTARQTAAAAAALGRVFSASDVAHMLDVSPAALVEPVQELLDADMFQEAGQRLAFRHDLIRQWVRAGLPAATRRSLDRHAVEILLNGGALPAEIGLQLADSAEAGDEAAIGILLRAAEAIIRIDPRTAALVSRRALELAPVDHPLRAKLVAQTVVALHANGQLEEATRFGEAAILELHRPQAESEIRLSIASSYGVSPSVRAAALRQALALPGLDDSTRAGAIARLAFNEAVAGEADRALRTLGSSDVGGLSEIDPSARLMGRTAESVIAYVDGRFEDSLKIMEEALRETDRARFDAGRDLSMQLRWGALSALDRVDEALSLAADAVADATRRHQGWALHVFETWRGRELLATGKLADAAAILDGQFPEADEHPLAVHEAAAVVAMARVALHTQNATLARRASSLADVMLLGDVPSIRHHAVWARALLSLVNGEREAYAALVVLGDRERLRILPRFPGEVSEEPTLVRIALAAGDDELAARTAAAARTRADRNPSILSLVGCALHAEGLVSESADTLGCALELLERAPRPLALGAVQEDLGALLIGYGDRDRAIDVLNRALATYAAVGATWDTARVRGRMRVLGVRRRLVSSTRPTTGWESLTATERAVVELVIEGMTNREVADHLFVSPHTVGSHLRRVFAKLEIRSRVELARLASEQSGPSR